jgi:cobalt transporter subunit CbtB
MKLREEHRTVNRSSCEPDPKEDLMSLLAEAARRRASSAHHAAISSSMAAHVGAAIVGLMLLYAAGFAQTQEMHDGAHDTRHSAGFPCH